MSDQKKSSVKTQYAIIRGLGNLYGRIVKAEIIEVIEEERIEVQLPNGERKHFDYDTGLEILSRGIVCDKDSYLEKLKVCYSMYQLDLTHYHSWINAKEINLMDYHLYLNNIF
ncbi:hypothetical protein [Flavobacteriaceae bacterium 14752]|uniref:hypothetical protein n=1 Tax=Mesohalobacter salilacus TaxID=2491711 RepID=UPI000F63491C|nr:hypothetical protein EIG84_05780 [Flavobacteriaceae bacterium 14752]